MKQLIAAVVLALFLISCTAPQASLPEQREDKKAMAPAEGELPAEEPEPAVDEQAESEEERRPSLKDDTADRLAAEQAAKIEESLGTVQKVEPRDRVTGIERMQETFKGIASYQFKTAKGKYFVRGEKVKFLPSDPVMKTNVKKGETLYRQVYLDEIILDVQEKIATGYCIGAEDDTSSQCAQLKLHDIAFPLPFDEYIIKLPQDWLLEYVDDVPVVEDHEKYYVKGLQTTLLKFKDGTELYFFPKAGLPVQVVPLGDALKKRSYEDLVVNQVNPEDVIHRSRADIPAYEAFYKPAY
jgi:hypothetical protein